MTSIKSLAFGGGLMAALAWPCAGQNPGQPQAGPTPASARTLVIATKEAPPFAMKNSDGTWHGISIELWQNLARKLNLDYEFREMDLQTMLEQTSQAKVDAALAAITATPEREQAMDFTHPYFSAGLGLAMEARRGSAWIALLRNLFSFQFLSAIAALAVVLLVAAFFVWLFEHRRNDGQFGGKPLHGLGASFWWSAVTMTTVGYGDKAPQTLGGRVVALIWMFTSVIIISTFTASIASAVTVHQLGSDLLRSRDLARLQLATVANSTGDRYARQNHLNIISFKTLDEALNALADRQADAVLYDIPILQYAAASNPQRRIEILPRVLVPEDYAIALPPGSSWRESLNIALLEALSLPEWEQIRYKYLGQ